MIKYLILTICIFFKFALAKNTKNVSENAISENDNQSPWVFSFGGEIKEHENKNLYYFFPRYQNTYKKWIFEFQWEFYFKEQFSTFESLEDFLRILQRIEYNDYPKKYFYLGRFEQDLGYSKLMESYTQGTHLKNYYPGALGYYEYKKFQFNWLSTSLTKQEVVGGRFTYQSDKSLKPLFGIEHLSDLDAPKSIINSKNNKPEYTSQNIHLYSLDAGVEFFQGTFKPFVTYSKIKSHGQAMSLGFKEFESLGKFKFETQLELTRQSLNYFSHYFDEAYFYEKYDYYPDDSLDQTKIEALNLSPKQSAFGYYYKQKIQYEWLNFFFGFEDRVGKKQGRGHLEVGADLKYFSATLKLKKSKMDNLNIFIDSPSKTQSLEIQTNLNDINLKLLYAQEYEWEAYDYVQKNALYRMNLSFDFFL